MTREQIASFCLVIGVAGWASFAARLLPWQALLLVAAGLAVALLGHWLIRERPAKGTGPDFDKAIHSWRFLANQSRAAASVLQESGATPEVIEVFAAAAREADGVVQELRAKAKERRA